MANDRMTMPGDIPDFVREAEEAMASGEACIRYGHKKEENFSITF